MSQELKLEPCPFCGAEPLMQEHPAHKHSIVGWPDHPGSWTIECPACECGMISDTRDNLLAAWNKRAQPAGEAEKPVACYDDSSKEPVLEWCGEDGPSAWQQQSGYVYLYAAPPAAANLAGVPEGWKLVPEVPTYAMKAAGAQYQGWDFAHATWTAMLSAAPHPTESQARGGDGES